VSSVRVTRARLFRLLWLSIAAAVATTSLKVLAWSLTGSVGHDEVERVEAALREAVPYATLFAHLEPIEDPRSYDDYAARPARGGDYDGPAWRASAGSMTPDQAASRCPGTPNGASRPSRSWWRPQSRTLKRGPTRGGVAIPLPG
jgi:hypothetical protein